MTTRGWEVRGDSSGPFHVLPVDDLRAHERSTTCWCKPTEDPDEADIWVHHSMDRREEYEQGRKPS